MSDCPHLGRELTGPERRSAGLDHARRWSLCLHPSQPLGPHVCPCRGCGTGCTGHPDYKFPRPGVAESSRKKLGMKPRKGLAGRVAGSMLAIPAPPSLDVIPTRSGVVVTIAVGDEGRALHAASGPHHRRYAESIGADYLVLSDYGGVPGFPMAMKLGLARVFDAGWEWLVYLDGDAVTLPSSVNLRELCPVDAMGVVDELPFHRVQPRFGLEASYRRFRRRMGFDDATLPEWYANAGVMVVPRSHRSIIEAPAELWVEDAGVGRHCAEQHLMNARLQASGLPVRLLDRRANWQSWTPGFDGAPADAVLHWSGSGGDRAKRVADIAATAAANPWPEPPLPPDPEPPPEPLPPTEPVGTPLDTFDPCDGPPTDRVAIRRGMTREVLLVGRWAVKVPSLRSWRLFVSGVLANLNEWRRSGLDPRLCPVVFSLLGLLLVMRRANPLPAGVEITADFGRLPVGEPWPVVPLPDVGPRNVGWLDGRPVIVDYGW